MDASSNDNNTPATTGYDVSDMYNSINSYLINPTVITVLVIVVVAYLALFMSFGSEGGKNMVGGQLFSSSGSSSTGSNSGISSFFSGSTSSASSPSSFFSSSTASSSGSSSASSSSGKWVVILLVVVLIVLVVLNGAGYYFGSKISASIKNFFSSFPQLGINVVPQTGQSSKTGPAPVPEIKIKKQVFNIPDNNFVYEDAKAICQAYGADLATYEQVEDAYNKGGEWCNYGWSDGQMALFPTQKSTWDQLQTIDGHENDCGRPGVNGGYMANPALKFGVNCYGYKPNITPTEQQMMQTYTPYPETQDDIAFQNRVNYWQNNLSTVLVSPFNYTTWSRL